MTNYTDAQKAEAVDLSVKVGTAEAARRMNVTTRTINNWMKAAGVTSAERAKKVEHTVEGRDAANKERRNRIRDKVLEKAENLLDRMDDQAKSLDVRNYAVSFGVLLDKYRLEMGEATEVIITGDMMDKALSDWETELGQNDTS